MGQYAICSEDLNEIEEQLHNTDHTDDQFDSIAPNIQNVELQDEAIGNEDLHPDFNENYDLSADLGVPSSSSFNNEPLILNELPDVPLAANSQIPMTSLWTWMGMDIAVGANKLDVKG